MMASKVYIATITILYCAILAAASTENTHPLPLPYANNYEQPDNALSPENEHVEAASGPYTQQFNNAHNSYTVQTGYESYLVPSGVPKAPEIREGALVQMYNFLEPVINMGTAVLPKVGLALVSILALLAIGTFVSTCVCAYTSLCHISFFGLDLTKEQVRGYLTQDRIAEAAHIVRSAIKKYQEINEKRSLSSKNPPK